MCSGSLLHSCYGGSSRTSPNRGQAITPLANVSGRCSKVQKILLRKDQSELMKFLKHFWMLSKLVQRKRSPRTTFSNLISSWFRSFTRWSIADTSSLRLAEIGCKPRDLLRQSYLSPTKMVTQTGSDTFWIS